MDRLELRAKFASRIEPFRLESFGLDVNLRGLSALERAKLVDKYRVLDKQKDTDNALETLTVETQCFIVSRGLVDEKGSRIYSDDEAPKIAEEFPCKAIDEIAKQILAISGMSGTQAEEIKNSQPTTSDSFSSALQ